MEKKSNKVTTPAQDVMFWVMIVVYFFLSLVAPMVRWENTRIVEIYDPTGTILVLLFPFAVAAMMWPPTTAKILRGKWRVPFVLGLCGLTAVFAQVWYLAIAATPLDLVTTWWIMPLLIWVPAFAAGAYFTWKIRRGEEVTFRDLPRHFFAAAGEPTDDEELQ